MMPERMIKLALISALLVSSSFAAQADEGENELKLIGEVVGRMFGCGLAVKPPIINLVTAIGEKNGMSPDEVNEVVMDYGKLAQKKQTGSDPWKCTFVQEQHDKLVGLK